MKFQFRPYGCEDDFWRMREFLRGLFVTNDRRLRSWHVVRLDYARWHSLINTTELTLADVAFLWESEGRLVALLLPDGGPGEAHACIHPDVLTRELEEEMLDVAEKHLARVKPDGSKSLYVWAGEHASLRLEILKERGYREEEGPEHQWRRLLDSPVPDVPIAPGYTVQPLGDGVELLERCYASGLGFHEGDLSSAAENRSDVTWYRNIQNAPLYRRDLDLVAVGPDGSVASFCTVWFDDVTRSAVFEPVATVPAHRRRGLAKAVMTEGLRRVKRLGATVAFVGGYNVAANALYRSVMGDDHELYGAWVREW